MGLIYLMVVMVVVLWCLKHVFPKVQDALHLPELLSWASQQLEL